MNLDDTAVILLHGGRTGRKSGALCLSKGHYRVNRQIATIKSIFGPEAEIIVVLGYQFSEVLSVIKQSVRIIENEYYDTTGPARSALLALRATTKNNAFILYGDLPTEEWLFPYSKQSYVIATNNTNMQSVGIIVENGVATNFSYGLSEQPKFNSFIYLNKDGVDSFKHRCERYDFMYEVMNKIIDDGVTIGVKSDS